MLEPSFLLNGQHQRVLPTIPSQLNLMSGVRLEGTYFCMLFSLYKCSSFSRAYLLHDQTPLPLPPPLQAFITYLLSGIVLGAWHRKKCKEENEVLLQRARSLDSHVALEF